MAMDYLSNLRMGLEPSMVGRQRSKNITVGLQSCVLLIVRLDETERSAGSSTISTGLVVEIAIGGVVIQKRVSLQSRGSTNPCQWTAKQEEGTRRWFWLGWPRRCLPPLQTGL
ncbi:hypothetical protein F0562_028447 [Nyssa sinensis]|uniref:Uncharacterized protein n=1 Tax=Nyssa sinensis TaxID=561372 RepID=A0A5J5AZY7_9ASTE|nr:hypothetical protein F0562_028447 [Nyssa sinensis]